MKFTTHRILVFLHNATLLDLSISHSCEITNEGNCF